MVDSTLSTVLFTIVTLLAAFVILSIPFTIYFVLTKFRLRKAPRYPTARLDRGGGIHPFYGLSGLSFPTQAPRQYIVNLPIRAPAPIFRITDRLDPPRPLHNTERGVPLGAMFLALGHINAPPLSAAALRDDFNVSSPV
ncbi:hypothetical protein B0H17DRAFT_1333678 [Mycena rosella]|uniref:Uncharacterized protein n=1 Tax=Mycena rosella TaxID=1033263 RepID=A0AAD7D6K3_MYCRO|nr:hypothetical protein B0H17DRAFT_1333678 [Mycena rosella]